MEHRTEELPTEDPVSEGMLLKSENNHELSEAGNVNKPASKYKHERASDLPAIDNKPELDDDGNDLPLNTSPEEDPSTGVKIKDNEESVQEWSLVKIEPGQFAF